ncbi:MAG: HAD family hydrolase [Planctomycetota bacterium]
MLFDAVLFDLDGTLVATDRFWAPAARTGCRRAFRELGLEREPPGADAWMSIVGSPLTEGLARLFPDLDPAALAVVERECMAEEHRQLDAGGAAPMPGAVALLSEIRAAGLSIGIASNCSAAYLEHMLGPALELGPLVHEARCLDSPGIGNKADMIADLLRTFGTRSAVFVGDRVTDRDAAWENGLPHVHCRFGFAAAGEPTAAEASIEDLGELTRVLRRRRAWLEQVFERAGVLRDLAAAAHPIAVGLTGPPASGKTLFARDAARVFDGHGIPAAAVGLERFRRAAGEPEDVLSPFDLARLEAEVLAPLERGELPADGVDAAADVLLLEGPGLLDPRLRGRLKRVLYLDLADELQLRRAAAQVPPGGDPKGLLELHRHGLPAHRALAERYPPAEHADLILDGSNPLGPVGLDPGPTGG